MKVLVSGCCGFIGSNFVELMFERHPDWEITNLDLLTYAANQKNCSVFESLPGYTFVQGSIADSELVDSLVSRKPDAIVNFAAETHVDRSIFDARAFVETNIEGTRVLLDAARKHGIDRFVQISTDEVYGSLGPSGLFREDHPIQPNSPYAASKAGGDLLLRSYFETYGFPALITRCSNNYGPHQYPEKLIPLFVSRLQAGDKIPVYGDGMQVREWTHVSDHSAAVEAVLLNGKPGEVYNIGAGEERTNLEVIRKMLALLGKDDSAIEFVPDRPGHDRRYGIDSSKIRSELGWSPKTDFDEGFAATVQWYVDHPDWWEHPQDPEFRKQLYGV